MSQNENVRSRVNMLDTLPKAKAKTKGKKQAEVDEIVDRLFRGGQT